MATGRTRFVELSDAEDYVWLGDAAVPRRMAYVIDGEDGEPSVRVSFEVREKKARCFHVEVVATDNGRGIRMGDLTTIPGLERLGVEAFARVAVLVGDPASDWAQVERLDVRGTARRMIATGGDAELEEVARVYRENVNGKPVEAVEIEFGMSKRTASRRVAQARKRGLLPPTSQGKKKA